MGHTVPAGMFAEHKQQLNVVLPGMYPWVGNSMVKAAPGHLHFVREMFEQAERDLGSRYLINSEVLIAITYDDAGELVAVFKIIDAPDVHTKKLTDELYTKKLTDELTSKSKQHCPICGNKHTIVTGTASVCPKHKNEWTQYLEQMDCKLDLKADVIFELAATPQQTQSRENEKNYPCVQVFEPRHIDEAEAESESGGDSAARIRALAKKLRKTSANKPLACLPEKWRAQLDELAALHPNFDEFVEYLKGQFALAALGDKRISIPPVMFSGPPGIGKTEIVLNLASLIRTGFLQIDMAGAQSGSALTGSEEFWSNSKEGKFFTLLTQGRTANPIVFLDELDKVSGDQRYMPSAGLYQLLEPATAMDFQDLSIPLVPLDASHVIWFAACNDPSKIDKPIRSRFVEFEIKEPDIEQSILIARTIYQRIRENNAWGTQFDSNLPDDVAFMLARMAPRLMRSSLVRACGVAALNSRTSLLPADIEPRNPKQRLGFIR